MLVSTGNHVMKAGPSRLQDDAEHYRNGKNVFVIVRAKIMNIDMYESMWVILMKRV